MNNLAQKKSSQICYSILKFGYTRWEYFVFDNIQQYSPCNICNLALKTVYTQSFMCNFCYNPKSRLNLTLHGLYICVQVSSFMSFDDY